LDSRNPVLQIIHSLILTLRDSFWTDYKQWFYDGSPLPESDIDEIEGCVVRSASTRMIAMTHE